MASILRVLYATNLQIHFQKEQIFECREDLEPQRHRGHREHRDRFLCVLCVLCVTNPRILVFWKRIFGFLGAFIGRRQTLTSW